MEERRERSTTWVSYLGVCACGGHCVHQYRFNPRTASLRAPTSSIPTASAPPTSTRPSGFISTPSAPPSNPGSATSTSIDLSQPPGSYTVPQYVLCGQQFMVFQGGTLYKYPDIPQSFKFQPDSPGNSMAVVLDGDCSHGGTVSVTPKGAAKVTSVAAATDGLPLVVEVTPAHGKTGTIAFKSSIGAAIKTNLE